MLTPLDEAIGQSEIQIDSPSQPAIAEEGDSPGERQPPAQDNSIRPNDDATSTPYSDLTTQMEEIAERLTLGTTDLETQERQQAVLAQLEEFVALARQQVQAAGTPSQHSAGSGPSEDPGGSGSESSAESSEDEPNGPLVPPENIPEVNSPSWRPEVEGGQLVEEVWGELPDRIRRRLPATSEEVFLPGYEARIEAYFRRLAERTHE